MDDTGTDKTYILDDRNEVEECDDMETWTEWMMRAATSGKLIVRHDELEGRSIITVFTGSACRCPRCAMYPPQVWETRLLRDGLPMGGKSHATIEDAIAEHEAVLAKLRKAVRRAWWVRVGTVAGVIVAAAFIAAVLVLAAIIVIGSIE